MHHNQKTIINQRLEIDTLYTSCPTRLKIRIKVQNNQNIFIFWTFFVRHLRHSVFLCTMNSSCPQCETNRNKDYKTQPEMPKTICCYNSLHSSCKVFLGPVHTKWSRSLHSHLSHRCWMEQRSATLPHQTLKATSWWTGLGALLYAVALPWKPQTKTTESCRQASTGKSCCCQSPRV